LSVRVVIASCRRAHFSVQTDAVYRQLFTAQPSPPPPPLPLPPLLLLLLLPSSGNSTQRFRQRQPVVTFRPVEN
jgi:hypothetical protein